MIRSALLAIVDAIVGAVVPSETEHVPSDRISNGGFDVADVWSIHGASWTIGAGIATAATGGGLNQTFSLVNSGLPVTITADVTNVNLATLTIRFLMDGAITQVAYASIPAAGPLTVNVTATAEFNGVRFTASNFTGLTLDNVTLTA